MIVPYPPPLRDVVRNTLGAKGFGCGEWIDVSPRSREWHNTRCPLREHSPAPSQWADLRAQTEPAVDQAGDRELELRTAVRAPKTARA